MKLIATGAEACIFEEGETIIKERTPKSYRHPSIDSSLRESRTRREAKALKALEKTGFPCPLVLASDDKKGLLTISCVQGEKLSHTLGTNPIEFGHSIGLLLGQLHNQDIIHGDPTTSNMILHPEKGLHLIDFGLSQFSKKIEDKAVDLHLLDRAVESAHHEVHAHVMPAVLEAYSKECKSAPEILSRLEAVRKRGRNKMKSS